MKKSKLNGIFTMVFFLSLIFSATIAHAQCTTAFEDSEQHATLFGDLIGFESLSLTEPSILIMELKYSLGGPSQPGTYRIEDDPLNANYSTCHTCVLIIDFTAPEERMFLAQSGELDIVSIGPAGEMFSGTLSNVDFIEVTIDQNTFVSTPVSGGETRCIESLFFNTSIQQQQSLDSDGDGLDDDAEIFYGTDPLNPDTDGGGAFDGQEIFYDGTDPLNPADDIVLDSDGDGLSDLEELTIFGTDPSNPDTDNDALYDGVEVLEYYTNPLNPDSDGGGVFDGQEIFVDGTDPLNPTDDLQPVDQDNDGFPFGFDCNDLDPNINPEAEEIWYDGVDQNCDGMNDFDQDFDGITIDQDCDDTNPLVKPGIPETCDGYDNNCDGQIDEMGSCIAVQLTWHTPEDPDESDNFGSDLDLHFLHPNGGWWELPWDCYWANKSPSWGASLNIDDTNSLGPEVISLTNPEGGVLYKVGVDYFSAQNFGFSYATVKIFINGHMAFEETSQPLYEKDFWEVAAIDWDSKVVTSLSDEDSDGVPDNVDSCLNSNLNETVLVDGCDSGVTNYLDSEGCTISDRIAECAVHTKNHGKFVSCVAHLTNELRSHHYITGKEKGSIQSCAAQANIP